MCLHDQSLGIHRLLGVPEGLRPPPPPLFPGVPLTTEDGGSHEQVRSVSPDLNVLRDGSYWWCTVHSAQLLPGSTDFHPGQLQAWAPLLQLTHLVCTPDTPARADAHAYAPHGLFQSPVIVKSRAGKILC